MDETVDDARYPPSSYGTSDQDRYGTSQRKLPDQTSAYVGQVGSSYDDEDEEDDEDEAREDGENGASEILMVRKEKYDVEDEGDDEDENDDEGDDEGEGEEDGVAANHHTKPMEDVIEQHPKKRKLKNLIANYEFTPRLPTVAQAPASSTKLSFGGRNPATDWTEHETFALLDAWGERFLQLGRKSLRSEEWQEVAEKVSQASKMERTDTQCRNRLDTLKKKYKKEKTRLAQAGGDTCNWVYFKKMDLLMSSPPQQGGLSCGMDSGEYIFMNPKVYLNKANGLDEMKDSPGNSESSKEKESDGPPPKKKRNVGKKNEGSSVGLLANSIHKFSELYEKIENDKREQILELEKMRMDFQRELEVQRKQILERAQAEIVRIREGIDEEGNNASAEDVSG